MSLASLATSLAERAPIPEVLIRAAIAFFVEGARRELAGGGPDDDAAFARTMADRPIAEHTADANAQHYEVPAAFFHLVLGPHLKYSSALFDEGGTSGWPPTGQSTAGESSHDARNASLAEAEERALAESCVHADLADGQRILELGCGWGSLSLWMARRYPAAKIVSVSNSASQRAEIEARAVADGLANLTVITADMNEFQIQERFDRVVSVEMFEHMANWRALLTRIAGWLTPEGRLFLHIFSHAGRPYRFDHGDGDDWIARHFFTGGLMPSQGLVRQFADVFEVEAQWRWSGDHYRRTANAWLANFDRNRAAIMPILRATYGQDAGLWARRWRLFFMATAGLFGAGGGEPWGVSHYRLKPGRGPGE
jgi:cyclopropane-fatty-acyl-phospholipid synthase